jgi:uncharacterized protein
MISWDEAKRRDNLRRHRIDLAELELVFDAPMVTVEDNRERYGELRAWACGADGSSFLSGHRAMTTART